MTTDEKLDRIAAALEKLLCNCGAESGAEHAQDCPMCDAEPDADLVTAAPAASADDANKAQDARVALYHLSKLRPFIERSADSRAIANYRSAVKDLRRQAAADARTFLPGSEQRSGSGSDFFEQARRFHRKNVQEVTVDETSDRAAQDGVGEPVDFFEASRKLHRRDANAERTVERDRKRR